MIRPEDFKIFTCKAFSDVNFFFSEIFGGDGTPYEKGIFKLEIQIPERYMYIVTVIL